VPGTPRRTHPGARDTHRLPPEQHSQGVLDGGRPDAVGRGDREPVGPVAEFGDGHRHRQGEIAVPVVGEGDPRRGGGLGQRWGGRPSGGAVEIVGPPGDEPVAGGAGDRRCGADGEGEGLGGGGDAVGGGERDRVAAGRGARGDQQRRGALTGVTRGCMRCAITGASVWLSRGPISWPWPRGWGTRWRPCIERMPTRCPTPMIAGGRRWTNSLSESQTREVPKMRREVPVP